MKQGTEAILAAASIWNVILFYCKLVGFQDASGPHVSTKDDEGCCRKAARNRISSLDK